MSSTAIYTSDAAAFGFGAGANDNRSDAWADAGINSPSVTAKLGAPTVRTQTTESVATSAINKIHMGTWVTDKSPEQIDIQATSTFVFHNFKGYQDINTLNTYPFAKVSIVTESGGTLTFDRTIIDWFQIAGELSNNIGSGWSFGAGTQADIASYQAIIGAETLLVNEMFAVEIGYDVQSNKVGTVHFEYGDICNDHDILDLTGSGTGPFGSEVVLPITFVDDAFQNNFGGHGEIHIPRVAGTNTIAWADVGTDWTAAKWVTTGATRHVSRDGDSITAQMWIFQDDDYLYVAMNNIIDGCIQPSDHHEVFLCPTQDWKNSLAPDSHDWLFRRDITSGTSLSRAPTLPVAAEDGNDQGEYILQGDNAVSGYPVGWEIPTYAAGPNTQSFVGNSKVFTEGVDYRMGGPGATATAPNPNGSPSGAYSEFKISKAAINNWNGSDPMGFMANFQCDVQGNGNTFFPTGLGNQIDKPSWYWSGGKYTVGLRENAAAKNQLHNIDLRVQMSMHGHGDVLAQTINPSVTFTGTTTTTDASISVTVDINPSITITGTTTTTDASISVTVDINPSVTITGTTTTTDSTVNIGYRPTVTITGSTTTTDALISVGMQYFPSVTITGTTTTTDSTINIGYRPTVTITGTTTTTNSTVNIGYRPTVTITGTTTTTDALISVAGDINPSVTITGTTTTTNSLVDVGYRPTVPIIGTTTTTNSIVNIGYKPTATITGTTTTTDALISVAGDINPSVIITGTTTTTDSILNIGYRPIVTITGTTTTTDASISVTVDINPSVTITGTTTTTDSTVNIGYRPTATITGSTTTTDASISVGMQYYVTANITGSTTTTDSLVSIDRKPAINITGTTTTTNSSLNINHFPTVVITGITFTQDVVVNIGHRVGILITSNTSTQDSDVVVNKKPTVNIIGSTTTTDSLVDVGYRPTVIVTGTTTTTDADISIAGDINPSVIVTGTTTTTDADISILVGSKTYNPTAIFPVYSRVRYSNIIILVPQGSGGGGFPVIAGGGYRESHVDAMKKRKLPTVKILKVEVLGESEKININISVTQVNDLLVEVR